MKVYRFASAPFISLSEWYIILFRENCEADISKYYFFINDVCNIIDLILAPEDERTKPDGRQSGFRFESDQTHIYISDFTYFFLFIYLYIYILLILGQVIQIPNPIITPQDFTPRYFVHLELPASFEFLWSYLIGLAMLQARDTTWTPSLPA